MGAQAMTSEIRQSHVESAYKMYAVRDFPLNLLLDTLGNTIHTSIRQVLYIRQSCVIDFFSNCSPEHRLASLELFEHCNEQIKLALGL